MRNHRISLVALGLATIAFAGISIAQDRPESPKDYPVWNAYPDENHDAVALHLSKARQIAGTDLTEDFYWRCMISPLDTTMVRGIQHPGLIPPTRIFDNFYSVGQNAVSSYVLETDEGLVVFDTLNNEAEAREIIVPNMVALGLDPGNIRYVILTHGHGDHWGGAKYLQDTYNARVVASAADWDLIEDRTARPGPWADMAAPKRDVVVKDGDVITLGNTSIQLYILPGHSPGALGAIFSVFDKGTKHMAALHGGSGGGRSVEFAQKHIKSVQRWIDLTKGAGVDVLITNHPAHNQSTEKQVLIHYAMPGDPNPFIIGADRHQRYWQVQEECARVWLARAGADADY